MGAWYQVPALVLMLLVSLSCTFRVGAILSEGEDDFIRVVQREKLCQEVTPTELRQIMGAAYNNIYMAEEAPQIFGRKPRDDVNGSTKGQSDGYDNGKVVDRPFFFKEDFEMVLSNEPAWTDIDFVAHTAFQNPVPTGSLMEARSGAAAPVHNRRRTAKRDVSDRVAGVLALLGDTSFKWHCEAPRRLEYLGKDYYPPYLMTVDCNHHRCQGSRFKCEPRSFAIKVLRKRAGLCAEGFTFHKETLEVGSSQMPKSLRQLWVWEVRAITFCCVCSLK